MGECSLLVSGTTGLHEATEWGSAVGPGGVRTMALPSSCLGSRAHASGGERVQRACVERAHGGHSGRSAGSLQGNPASTFGEPRATRGVVRLACLARATWPLGCHLGVPEGSSLAYFGDVSECFNGAGTDQAGNHHYPPLRSRCKPSVCFHMAWAWPASSRPFQPFW